MNAAGRVELFDVNGRCVLRQDIAGSRMGEGLLLDAGRLAQGTYFVRFTVGTRSAGSRMMVTR